MEQRGNQIEEDRLLAEIGRVVSVFPSYRRDAVTAFLLRAVFGWRYERIGGRLGVTPMQGWRLKDEGRIYLDELIRKGRITRERTLEMIRDLMSEYA
jgi:hypothetical protein